MIRRSLIPLAIGLVVFFIAQAISWPFGYALALGAGATAIAAAASLLRGIDTEKTPDFESQAFTGLRPSVATTAGAFREPQLSGTTLERLGAVVADFSTRHQLTNAQARELFGPEYDALVSGQARITPATARQLLRTIAEKDRT